MIIITNDQHEYDSAMAALRVINAMRDTARPTRRQRLAFMEDTPWIKTRWPNEKYL